MLTASQVAPLLGISARKVYAYPHCLLEKYLMAKKPDERRRANVSGILQAGILEILLESIPGTRARNWRQQVIAEMSDLEHVEGFEEDFAAAIMGLRFVPDAFLINKAEPELHFFEVEVHSPMNSEKLLAYGKFAIDLAFYGIQFDVFAVNKHGHINQVLLLPHYAEWLAIASQEVPA